MFRQSSNNPQVTDHLVILRTMLKNHQLVIHSPPSIIKKYSDLQQQSIQVNPLKSSVNLHPFLKGPFPPFVVLPPQAVEKPRAVQGCFLVE